MAIVCLMAMVTVSAHNVHYPTYTIDGITYMQNSHNISSSSEGKLKGCDIIKVDKPYDKTITIPYRLIINGEKFQVCSIKENAFSTCISLDSLILSDGLLISDCAFNGCKKLEYLYYSNRTHRTYDASRNNYYNGLFVKTLETSLGCCDETFWEQISASLEKLIIIEDATSINTRMDNCPHLKTIVCYPTTPPFSKAAKYGNTSCTISFESWQWATITLYVPRESLEKYYFHETWGEIDNIYAIDEMKSVSTSINPAVNSVTTDDTWYTLNGTRVENPTKGVYIKNGKKYILK